jgi:hypothetical protein
VRTVTRRSLFGLGAAGVISASAYGRYALDDRFEEHLASVLGVPIDGARSLARQARDRLGETRYDSVAAAFVASTTAPGRWVLPDGFRRRSVHVLLSEAVPDSHGNLVLLGLVGRSSPGSSCAGLLRT